MKTAAFYLSLACLSFALSASAQTADISDDGLNGLQKKPKVIAAGDVAKNSKSITKGAGPGTPALKPGEMRFTKAARIVSQPDGSLVESPLVEIPVLFDQGKATLRADAVSQRNLRRLAEAILAIKDADARFTIGGFASAEGDGSANSAKRTRFFQKNCPLPSPQRLLRSLSPSEPQSCHICIIHETNLPSALHGSPHFPVGHHQPCR